MPEKSEKGKKSLLRKPLHQIISDIESESSLNKEEMGKLIAGSICNIPKKYFLSSYGPHHDKDYVNKIQKDFIKMLKNALIEYDCSESLGYTQRTMVSLFEGKIPIASSVGIESKVNTILSKKAHPFETIYNAFKEGISNYLSREKPQKMGPNAYLRLQYEEIEKSLNAAAKSKKH
jgi:hypothetical protein